MLPTLYAGFLVATSSIFVSNVYSQYNNPVVRCTRFSDEDLNQLIVHYDDEDIRAGSTAHFSCKDNDQELSGKKELVCLRNGKWSSPPPHCNDRCPPIDENEDFAIFYSNGRNVNSKATFYCKDTKLLIQGDHIKTCLPTGQWSAANPTCKDPVERCTRFLDEELNLLIVQYDDKNIRVGSRAHFSCQDNDHELSGKNESVCLRNGKWSSPPPQCRDCGYVSRSNRAEGELPWMVAITRNEETKEKKRNTHWCNGFLIDRRHVLTAAHCFILNYKLDDFTAHIGKRNWKEGEKYNISYIAMHPRFDPQHVYDDIAILTLSSDVDTPNYKLICLPDYDLRMKRLYGLTVTKAAWGMENKGIISNNLTQVTGLRIISNKECNRLLHQKLGNGSRSHFPGEVSGDMICTVNPSDQLQPCRRSDGAPLMYKGDNNKWIAVGMSVFVYSCTTEGFNGHIKLSDYMEWIMENTRNERDYYR